MTDIEELRKKVEDMVIDLWLKYDNGNWFVNDEDDPDGRNNDHRYQDAQVEGFLKLVEEYKSKEDWRRNGEQFALGIHNVLNPMFMRLIKELNKTSKEK